MKTMIAIHDNCHEPFSVCGIFIGDYCTHFADTFGTYQDYPEDNTVSAKLQAVIRADMAKIFPGARVVFRNVEDSKFNETCKAYNEISG